MDRLKHLEQKCKRLKYMHHLLWDIVQDYDKAESECILKNQVQLDRLLEEHLKQLQHVDDYLPVEKEYYVLKENYRLLLEKHHNRGND